MASKCTGNSRDAMLRIVQEKWPACCDIRLKYGTVQVAVFNTGGGKHWIDLTIAPYDVELSLYKAGHIDKLTPKKNKHEIY